MTTILLLEKKTAFSAKLADFLTGEGYRVLVAGKMAEFKLLKESAFDIAIIDADLPDGNGMKIAAGLRIARPKCGIVMFATRNVLKEKIASLSEAADIYLVKDICFDELRAYLIALKRRVNMRWQLRVTERKLLSPNGYAELLNEQELALVEILARNMGEVVTRREIAEAFGIDWLQFDGRRLDQIVSRLRRRWLKHSGTKLPFRTEHGKGYIFSAEIDLI